MRRIPPKAAICLLFIVLGCGGGSEKNAGGPKVGDISRGKTVFENPIRGGNNFSCITCHDIHDGDDEYRRAGHPVGNAANRPTYKNGKLTALRDAANACVTIFMTAPKLAEDSQEWLDMQVYLESFAGEGDSPAIEISTGPLPEDLSTGDSSKGESVYGITCALCHGASLEGSSLGPPLNPENLTASSIGSKVRKRTAIMPYWSLSRLSNDEMLDVIAWILSRSN